MRKTVVLTPFHEEYLANTVAQVKDLLWAQFEEKYKESIKDEPYQYKTEDIVYQDRIVAENENYRKLLKYILEGGKVKFQREKYEKKGIELKHLTPLSLFSTIVNEYSDDGECTGYYWDLTEEDKVKYSELSSLSNNSRAVLSFIEYPESWLIIYKKSTIGFQPVALKKQEILKIFNRNRVKGKGHKHYANNEGLFKLKITKSGFVRYFNGQSSRWLSLKNWHNTKTPFSEDVLRLLISINPNNEFLRKEKKYFYFTRYDIGNKDLRNLRSWKAFYKSQAGFYIEHIPLIIAKDIASKIPQKAKLEAFCNRIKQEHLPKDTDKYIYDVHKAHFETVYASLLGANEFGENLSIGYPNGSFLRLVVDAYSIAKDLNEEFNLKIESAKKFQEYHDDLAKRHRLKQLGPLTPHEKFKVLKSGKYEVEFIETSERLVRESVELCHCVSSYAHSINTGTCGIYSIWDGENRWTCELRYRKESENYISLIMGGKPHSEKKGFWIAQCRGLYNKNAPEEIIDFVQQQLDEVNKENN